jgi:hypothetical protein
MDNKLLPRTATAKRSVSDIFNLFFNLYIEEMIIFFLLLIEEMIIFCSTKKSIEDMLYL